MWRVKERRENYRKTVVTPLLMIIALGFLGYGGWGLWQRYSATHAPTPIIPTEVVTHSTNEPEETPPACDDSYKVPANEPRKIEIPSIGVSGCIQKVGVDEKNAIAVPTNIHVAGWYINSPLPGEKGVSVIDGHVLGQYDDAIFAKLKDINAGDTIRIEFGDGSKKEFLVEDSHSYPVDEVMSHLFSPLEAVDNQLTLITCGGTFDRAAQTYDERIIVRAALSE